MGLAPSRQKAVDLALTSKISEYPALVIPVTTAYYPLLQRNLIYTGIIRSKQAIAIAMAVRNSTPHQRHTRLALRLREWGEE